MIRPKSSLAVKLTIVELAGVGVDLDLGDMRARREGEVLRVVERGLVEPRLQLLMRVVVRHIGGQRDLAEALRAVGAGDGELAVLELDIGLGRFEQMGGDLACPWRRPCPSP